MSRTMQEYRTTLAPAEVLAKAKTFFGSRNPLYAAYIDKEGPNHCSFRGQGGEEIVIAAAEDAEGTLVTGSTYLFEMQLSRFFTTLPPSAAGTAS